MADSLFDHRYRYDYIYPRGRSGETLRAVDTQNGDRPVVVKRPAPNDAPPIRAGQEVSILNERKALARLAGQPALCTLVGTGQFTVGGMAHQYIVIERAEGAIIADEVAALAGRGERLPELEMLVIVDALIDLLMAAHAHEIVYNDVDAKHLFWNREIYRLKVIDWGNAVFLEGDEATSQGISRASDIYQTGELLYFLVTGGGRVEVTRDAARAGEDFRLDFGADAERLHSRLQAIISRAAHPNPRLRYPTLADLRAALAEYATPIVRDRDAVIARVTERLKRDLSRDDLNAVQRMLTPALTADPGFPFAREAASEIVLRLGDLAVAGDLDAARIYLDTANWMRAAAVLDELRPRARGGQSVQIGLLTEWAWLLAGANIQRTTPALQDAVEAVFAGNLARASFILQTDGIDDPAARHIQWLLAERISAEVPELLLLRPNLYRLETALATLHGEGAPVHEARVLLAEAVQVLEALADPSIIDMAALRDGFSGIVDGLTALNTLLEAVQVRAGLPPRKLPMNAVVRALNAAMAITDNMHIIGREATSTREAYAALEASREIAPSLPVWDGIAHLLASLYEQIGAYQRYTPAADGSDVAEWLTASARDLAPFTGRLFDESLVSMVFSLNAAARSWAAFSEALVQGGRGPALASLQTTMDAVGAVSPTLAAWLGQVKTIIAGAGYIERHALHGALGRALADGWENFDRGRLSEAERLGLQAAESAQTEAEQQAAHRLKTLASLAREWMERGGALDAERTTAALTAVEALYTRDEITARDSFAAQMPGRETYLKAMSKSLVENLARISTASVRLLYTQSVLNAALAAQVENDEDWRFWRDSAVKTMGEAGLRHPLMRALIEMLDRRRDLRTAAAVLASVQDASALYGIEQVRRSLEDSPQVALLQPAILSLRELDGATRDWADGDFRAAGLRLENALRALHEVTERQPDFAPAAYETYLDSLLAGAAALHQRGRKLAQIIDAPPDDAPPLARTIHHEWVDTTARLIGEERAVAMRRWRDMYETFAALHMDRTLRRSARLPRFTDLFAVQGIDRHPAYALYRHWQLVTEQASEFPAPATVDPTPRLADDALVVEDEDALAFAAPSISSEPAQMLDPAVAVTFTPDTPARRGFNPLIVVAVLIVALIGAGVIAVLSSGGAGQETASPSPGDLAVGSAVTDPPTATPDPATAEAAATRNAAQTAIAQIGVTLTLRMETPATLPPAAETPALLLILPTLPPPTPSPLSVLATVAPRQSETAAPTRTPSQTFTPTQTPTATQTATPSPTRTPSATATRPTLTPSQTPTATLPPQGVQGEIDVLAWLADAASAGWLADAAAADAFTPGEDGAYWRLGIGAALPALAETVVIAPARDGMDARFGNAASGRVLRSTVDLALITFNPPLLVDEDVYFGFVLQSPQTADQSSASVARRVGIEVQVVQQGIVNIALIDGETRTVVSQRADGLSDVRLRLERDLVSGEVVVYYNDESIGRLSLAADAPVVPALYIHNGGVIVHVREWTATLR